MAGTGTYNDTFLTLSAPSTGLYKDKGSKFLAFAYPVSTEQEIKNLLADIKKKHFDARHHCFAYIIGAEKTNYRAFDDGEPSGTAGKPILGQINSKNLTNIFIVVVRYFGGTLLGTSGLIQAYKMAAADAIENATIVEEIVKNRYKLTFGYEVMNDVMKVIKDNDLEQVSHNFDISCMIEINIRMKLADNIIAKLKKIETVSVVQII